MFLYEAISPCHVDRSILRSWWLLERTHGCVGTSAHGPHEESSTLIQQEHVPISPCRRCYWLNFVKSTPQFPFSSPLSLATLPLKWMQSDDVYYTKTDLSGISEVSIGYHALWEHDRFSGIAWALDINAKPFSPEARTLARETTWTISPDK